MLIPENMKPLYFAGDWDAETVKQVREAWVRFAAATIAQGMTRANGVIQSAIVADQMTEEFKKRFIE